MHRLLPVIAQAPFREPFSESGADGRSDTYGSARAAQPGRSQGRPPILDVRTPAEYDSWHIPGAVLIPYTELRQRLDEVPRDKPVYTHCRSGFRSYIAHCVLKQNGWDDAAFLADGMMTYHGYHQIPLAVGRGGMSVIAHAEDLLAQRPGPLEHV
jgi:rhodanese-related sulfurtransferase